MDIEGKNINILKVNSALTKPEPRLYQVKEGRVPAEAEGTTCAKVWRQAELDLFWELQVTSYFWNLVCLLLISPCREGWQDVKTWARCRDYCLPYHGFCLGDGGIIGNFGSRFKTLFTNSSSTPSLVGMFQYPIKCNDEK